MQRILTSGYPLGSMKSAGTILDTFALPCFLPSLGGEGLAVYSVKASERILGVRGKLGEPLVPSIGESIFGKIIVEVVPRWELLSLWHGKGQEPEAYRWKLFAGG